MFVDIAFGIDDVWHRRRILRNREEGEGKNGLGAMRNIVYSFELKTDLATGAIITNPSARRVEEMKANRLRFEPHMKGYEATRDRWDDYFEATVPAQSCVRELRDRFGVIRNMT